ncbi:MAG: chloride channel protein [Chitinophaga sp.]|uniref:chloride channel protein n=1 Tax=Chitinophaga sp. TaxID=1869181 RepID=UPI0025C0F47F|nr:chloride channel protein [Chitinophaga sp.]MBV8254899.1 chloride channel protein [Chitinophaga sp.]
MKNGFYSLNAYRTPVVPPEWLRPKEETNNTQAPPLIRLSLVAVLSAILGMSLAWGISYCIPVLANLLFLGRVATTFPDLDNSGLGIFLIIIPVVGAASWLLARKKINAASPIGLSVAAATGAPVGMDGIISLGNITIVKYLAQIFKLTATEGEILAISGIAGAFTWCFGAPVAALLLTIELFLSELTAVTLIPLILAIGVATIAQLFLNPFSYDFTVSNSNEYTLIWLYAITGVVTGLLAAMYRKLYLWLNNRFRQTNGTRVWWFLLCAAIAGVAIYVYPETAGPGNNFLLPLLHGTVTFRVILVMGVIRLLVSVVYNGGLNTGTTITNTLLIGAGWGMLIGFIFQLCFPKLHVSPSMVALVGMLAMFTASTRAIITALILAVEISRDIRVLPFVIAACFTAYAVTYLLSAKKVKQLEIAAR